MSSIFTEFCFCSRDAKNNPIVQEYILPDFSSNRQGGIKKPDDIVLDTDQILIMNNERFTIPETIFRPDDIGTRSIISSCLYYSPFCVLYIGLSQSGLAGTVAASISALPEELRGMFWANIGLIGGTTKFPGFQQRLYVPPHHHIHNGNSYSG